MENLLKMICRNFEKSH